MRHSCVALFSCSSLALGLVLSERCVLKPLRPHVDLTIEAATNATMQRIDLLCKVLAPASIGFLVEFSPITWALCIVALWNVLSYFPEALALYGIHRKHRALLVKNVPSTVGDVETESTEGRGIDQGEENENNEKPTRSGACWTGVYSAVQVYARQDAFLASLAFCWLFLTTLSPGGLTTAFLKSRVRLVTYWMQSAKMLVVGRREMGFAVVLTAIREYQMLCREYGWVFHRSLGSRPPL